jgi:hypothetical protein
VLTGSHIEMHLDGRGIELVPSVFVGKTPALHSDPNDERATPRLVLPMADDGIGPHITPRSE